MTLAGMPDCAKEIVFSFYPLEDMRILRVMLPLWSKLPKKGMPQYLLDKSTT